MTLMSSQVLIIGIGNQYRRDDGVGLVMARRLRGRAPSTVSIIEQTGEGAALLESWRGYSQVSLLDAVDGGARPGKLYRLEAHTAAFPPRLFHLSSHAFGVAEAVELARAWNQLPRRLVLYGIQGQDFGAGVGLSAAVERSVPLVLDQVLDGLPPRSPVSVRATPLAGKAAA